LVKEGDLIQSPDQHFAWVPYLVLVCAVLLAYANVYQNAFLFDDIGMFGQNTFLRHWSNLPDLVTSWSFTGSGQAAGFYRPMLMLIYFFTYQAFGLSTTAFHALNVALHTVNACLVCNLGCRIGLKRWYSFSAALLWALHPLNTEAVTYMSGTADPLYSFFCLLGLLVLLPDFAPRRFWMAGILFAFALASKESSVMFPALVTITLFLVDKNRLNPAIYIRTWPLWLLGTIFSAVWITYLHSGAFQIENQNAFYFRFYAHSITNRILTCLATLPVYLSLMLLPKGLHMERGFSVFTRFCDRQVIAGAGILVGAFLQIAWGKGSRGLLVSWGLLWFAVAYSPTSGIIVPADALIFEHWMYLPTIGIAVCSVATVASFLDGQPKTSKIGAAVLTMGIALGLGIKTHVQNKIWYRPDVFYENIFRCGEQSGRAHANLASFYLEQGDYAEAIKEYRIAIASPTMVMQSRIPLLHTELALAFLRVKLEDDDTITIPDVLRVLPFSSGVPEAIQELNSALEIDPGYYWANKILAAIYIHQRDYEKAAFYDDRAEGKQ
jgi:protein O-mannosyl-transferase